MYHVLTLTSLSGYSFAFTSMSFRDFPLLKDISGGSLKFAVEKAGFVSCAIFSLKHTNVLRFCTDG